MQSLLAGHIKIGNSLVGNYVDRTAFNIIKLKNFTSHDKTDIEQPRVGIIKTNKFWLEVLRYVFTLRYRTQVEEHI